MMLKLITVILLFYCAHSLNNSDGNFLSSDECNLHQTSCHECIQVPGCAWDFSNLNDTEKHCFRVNGDIAAHNERNVYSPENVIFIKENKPTDENIRIAPQKVKISVRPRLPLYFNIMYENPDSIQPPHFKNIAVEFIYSKHRRILVRIEALTCPKNPSKHHQIIDLVSHQSNQSLIVEIELICTCPCEHPDHPSYSIKSKHCSNVGTHVCGKCECQKGSVGPQCECPDSLSTENCRQGNEGMICSGLGNCICGRCQCLPRTNPEEKVFGDFCECDNFSCPRSGGKICAGHGYCECGICACREDWTGTGCNHQISKHKDYYQD